MITPTTKTDVKALRKSLKEHCLYEVLVSWSKQNPIHKAFLFMGFKNGNYCKIYNNNYDLPIDIEKAYYIHVVKVLSSTR